MALDSRKRIVIYGALSVVVLGVAVIGILAATGRLKIRADVATGVVPDDATANLSRWLLPGRWNLVTIPCNSNGAKITDKVLSTARSSDANGYRVQYDPGSDPLVVGGNIVFDTSENLGNRARGYWIKANPVSGNQIYHSCPLPTTDVTIPLKVGASVPVGNPFGVYEHVSGIKLVVDGTEIPLATALNNKQVQLAFYRAGNYPDNPSTDTDAYTIVGDSDENRGRDALVDDALGGAPELAPFAGFYVAVANSLGNSTVGLKFTAGAASTNCADPCATTCKAWGEKSEEMVASKAAFCAARPTQ